MLTPEQWEARLGRTIINPDYSFIPGLIKELLDSGNYNNISTASLVTALCPGAGMRIKERLFTALLFPSVLTNVAGYYTKLPPAKNKFGKMVRRSVWHSYKASEPEKTYEQGYKEGYDKGYDEGYQNGWHTAAGSECV